MTRSVPARLRVGSSRPHRLLGAALTLALGALTCGPRHGSQAAAPAIGAVAGLPSGPPPARVGLELPRLDVVWAPPALTAGDAEGLAAALARHAAVEVTLGPALQGTEARVAPVIAGLSPRTTVTGIRAAEQAGMVRDPAALVAAREPGPGRPRYRAEGLQVQETWLKRHDPKATAIVSLDASAVDLSAWGALPAATVGSCEPATLALAEAQEQGLVQLEGRRFVAGDLAEARGRLRRIGETLASPELARSGARWQIEAAELFVPGVGPMRQFARFEPGAGSVNPSIAAEARALREFVLSRALCRSGHDPRPLSVLVAGVDGGPPGFFGYLYAEELFCGELPPRVGVDG